MEDFDSWLEESDLRINRWEEVYSEMLRKEQGRWFPSKDTILAIRKSKKQCLVKLNNIISVLNNDFDDLKSAVAGLTELSDRETAAWGLRDLYEANEAIDEGVVLEHFKLRKLVGNIKEGSALAAKLNRYQY